MFYQFEPLQSSHFQLATEHMEDTLFEHTRDVLLQVKETRNETKKAMAHKNT